MKTDFSYSDEDNSKGVGAAHNQSEAMWIATTGGRNLLEIKTSLEVFMMCRTLQRSRQPMSLCWNSKVK